MIWATKIPSRLGMFDIQAQTRTQRHSPYRAAKKSRGTKPPAARSLAAASRPATISPPPHPMPYHMPGQIPLCAPCSEPPMITPAPICMAASVVVVKSRLTLRPAIRKSEALLARLLAR